MGIDKKIEFHKYEGAGNDFILIEDCKDCLQLLSTKEISRLCNRHFGIGADGLILIKSSDVADVQMVFFNSDGSKASMCGNALRCVVKHINQSFLTIETGVGILKGYNLDEEISICMPKIHEISPMITLGDGSCGHYIDAGVPHLIIPIDELDIKNFDSKAREAGNHSMFQLKGVNVSYIKIDGQNIHIRTYERGVESETLACGTAGAAAAYITQKFDDQKKMKYNVYPKSGDLLQFSFDSKKNLWMKGPARMIFQGQVYITSYKQSLMRR